MTSSFYEKQLILESQFEECDDIVMFRGLQGDLGVPLAKICLKPDTVEYFNIASNQITIIPYDKNQHIKEILNDTGKKLYKAICNKANKHIADNTMKATISNYSLVISNSGSWFADPNSPHYYGINGSFNSFHNLYISGDTTINESGKISTSVCVFITDNWCFTKSGSFYKLENPALST